MTIETMTSLGLMPQAASSRSTSSAVELLVRRVAAWPAGHLQENDLVGARDAQAGILDDQARGLVLIDDLVAVAHRHAERLDHRLVRGIEEDLQLGVGATLDEIEAEKRHG